MEIRQTTSRIIIHHSATDINTTTIKAIRDYHVKVLHWQDIAYHYVIDRGGNCLQGRPEQYIGAHAKDANYDSVGICLIGDFNLLRPGRPQVETLGGLLCNLAKKYALWESSIIGHRDVNATDCPGRHLYESIPSLRDFVQKHRASCPMWNCGKT